MTAYFESSMRSVVASAPVERSVTFSATLSRFVLSESSGAAVSETLKPMSEPVWSS